MTYKVFTSDESHQAGQRQWVATNNANIHGVSVVRGIKSFDAVFIDQGLLIKMYL